MRIDAQTIIPPHAAHDSQKVDRMVQAIDNSDWVPQIRAIKSGSYWYAIEGSHRIAACREFTDWAPDVIPVTATTMVSLSDVQFADLSPDDLGLRRYKRRVSALRIARYYHGPVCG